MKKKLLIGAAVVLAIPVVMNIGDDEPTPAPPAATSSAAPSTTEAASPTPTPSEAQDPYYAKGYEMVQGELADVTDCLRLNQDATSYDDGILTWLDRGEGKARVIALLSGQRDAAQDRAAEVGC